MNSDRPRTPILVWPVTMMLKSMNPNTHMSSPRLNSSPSMVYAHVFSLHSSLRSHVQTTASPPPLFQKPGYDGQLPVAADGVISDVHVTAFLTAVDSLLSAGRSNAPTRVLTPMKSVVNAVANILNDVRSHSRRHSDPKGVHSLEERIEMTLSNLVAASTTHATSSGFSAVSLLDAAASHVSEAVTELGRVVLLRRATSAEQEQFAPSSLRMTTNVFMPHPHTIEEMTPSVAWQRGWNAASLRQGERVWESEPPRGEQQFAHSELRSNDISGSEESWTELRVRVLPSGLSSD